MDDVTEIEKESIKAFNNENVISWVESVLSIDGDKSFCQVFKEDIQCVY